LTTIRQPIAFILWMLARKNSRALCHECGQPGNPESKMNRALRLLAETEGEAR